jgi:hypothetical protein
MAVAAHVSNQPSPMGDPFDAILAQTTCPHRHMAAVAVGKSVKGCKGQVAGFDLQLAICNLQLAPCPFPLKLKSSPIKFCKDN